jgi:hypothetical protein
MSENKILMRRSSDWLNACFTEYAPQAIINNNALLGKKACGVLREGLHSEDTINNLSHDCTERNSQHRIRIENQWRGNYGADD